MTEGLWRFALVGLPENSLPVYCPSKHQSSLHAPGPLCDGNGMASRRRSPVSACHQCLIMACALLSKTSLFPGEKVCGIILYKEVLSCLLFNESGLSLNSQSTALKKNIFRKNSSGPTVVCLHLNTRGGFVSPFPRDNGCSLQREAELFYLCNQRGGSALRWDKLITPSL